MKFSLHKSGISKNCKFAWHDFWWLRFTKICHWEMDWSLLSIRKYYNVSKEIRIKTSMLRSNLCDFSDAYIVVKGNTVVTEPNEAKRRKSVALKSNAPFINAF